MAYNIKTIRQEFKDKGIFYTDSKLAEIMRVTDKPDELHEARFNATVAR